MTSAATSFVYVTYIKTTPDRLWTALTSAEFTEKYWFGMLQETDWTKGSPWKLVFPDGRVADAGEIIEATPPTRLAIRWRNEWKPELKAEGHSQCTFDIEQAAGAVKLTVSHVMDHAESQLIAAVSGGWPRILSNLKSLLETGEVALSEK